MQPTVTSRFGPRLVLALLLLLLLNLPPQLTQCLLSVASIYYISIMPIDYLTVIVKHLNEQLDKCCVAGIKLAQIVSGVITNVCIASS